MVDFPVTLSYPSQWRGEGGLLLRSKPDRQREHDPVRSGHALGDATQMHEIALLPVLDVCERRARGVVAPARLERHRSPRRALELHRGRVRPRDWRPSNF